MYIDMSTLSPGRVYLTMIQTLIPRPIAWVLSENEDATYNLAPFSYFNAVCSDPPLIMFSVSKQQDGRDKDTRANIEARGEFVIHIAHREMANDVTQSSATLAPGESEVSAQGLDLAEFENFSLPRLRDVRIAYACKLDRVLEVGNNNQQGLIFGEVQYLYADDGVLGEDAKGRSIFAAEKIDPIGRLGGGEYTTFGDKFFIPRPQ